MGANWAAGGANIGVTLPPAGWEVAAGRPRPDPPIRCANERDYKEASVGLGALEVRFGWMRWARGRRWRMTGLTALDGGAGVSTGDLRQLYAGVLP